MDYAQAVREEIADLFAAGADVVQLDEPWMQAFPEEARRYAIPAINRALAFCAPRNPPRVEPIGTPGV